MIADDQEVKDFALIGAGPVGIFLSHLLVSKGHRVVLYEAGDRDAETTNLNLDNYVFKTKSKIPSGVHRVGGASNLWKRRVSEFSTQVFNRNDKDGKRIWPLDFEVLEKANEILFTHLGEPGLRDQDYREKYFNEIDRELPGSLDLNLFRFSEENFFIKLLSQLESKENFKLVTKTLVMEIRLPKQSESKQNNIELVLAEAGCNEIKSGFHSDAVLTGGCLQSTALALKSPDIINRLSSTDIIGKYLMEHFDGYVGTLRLRSKDRQILKKLVLDDNRMIPGKDFGVGVKLPDDTNGVTEEVTFHLELVNWRKTYLFDPSLNVFNGLPAGLYKRIFFLERVAKKIPSELRRLWFMLSSTEIYSVWLKGEEIPFAKSQIQISRDKDPWDIKLIYNHRVSSETKIRMRKRLQEFSACLKKNNLGKFRIHTYFHFNRLFYTGPNFHPMGSLRMGVDPKNSVICPDFSFHGSPHVFAVNSGIFPNGSNHNPTAMVLALSIVFASSF